VKSRSKTGRLESAAGTYSGAFERIVLIENALLRGGLFFRESFSRRKQGLDALGEIHEWLHKATLLWLQQSRRPGQSAQENHSVANTAKIPPIHRYFTRTSQKREVSGQFAQT
jgi:hypothetical protein